MNREPCADAAASDEELLALLRACYETADPMPPTLVERTLHEIALRGPALRDPVFEDPVFDDRAFDTPVFADPALDDPPYGGLAGLVRLAGRRSLEPVGARGGDAGVITFESDDLTVMIRISRQGEAVRLDGWLAPPGPDQVRLRTEGGAMDAAVDEEGRFVLDVTVRGPVQLVVRHGAPQAAGWRETVLVPAIVL